MNTSNRNNNLAPIATASPIRKLALACLLAWGGAVAHADVVHDLHLQFSNGGVFDGTVTFKNDYSSLLGTDGTLVGGSTFFGGSYGIVDFNWTWYQGAGPIDSQDEDNNANTLEDYLMQGPDINNSDFKQIGLSWFVPVVGNTPTLNLQANRIHAALDGFYRITSYEFGTGTVQNNVPEPGSLALLGLALAGMAVVAKQRKARA
jgi:hypothetical protein